MLITENKTSQDWLKLKIELESNDNELMWMIAYNDFFWSRINSRYFEPIKKLRENDSYLGYGFTIMTILCSLIEFLESSCLGKNYRHCKDKDLKLYEYNRSKDCFIDFLVSRPPFSERFNRDIASEFYSAIRCGLLHEASTKDGWKIWGQSESGEEIICYDQKKVFRDDFEDAVKKYISIYRDELIKNNELKMAFIRKFDSLCQ
ncbi:hypothetical protein QLG02_12445 [Aeromonas sp. V90_14]|uniref:hypothetical protein n=1 Tax=Aeromonas sp. V90_14 TaxID=3044241 RepID=UPI00249EF9C8|nr:hypothetical protein [Aeromonas sp. V90_14]MDI3431139.1 hypothetical protein [Aeromonas sp. V90_14]